MKDWLQEQLNDLRGLREHHLQQYWTHVGAVQAIEQTLLEFERQEKVKEEAKATLSQNEVK